MRKNVCFQVISTALLVAFGLAAQGMDSRALIDRTQKDIGNSLEFERHNGKEVSRYDNAEHHLSEFDREFARGHFDKGKLDQAIDDVKNLVDNNTLSPDLRDAISADLRDLRVMRGRTRTLTVLPGGTGVHGPNNAALPRLRSCPSRGRAGRGFAAAQRAFRRVFHVSRLQGTLGLYKGEAPTPGFHEIIEKIRIARSSLCAYKKTSSALLVICLSFAAPAVFGQLSDNSPTRALGTPDVGGNLPIQKLGPQDLLSIRVYDSPEFSLQLRVLDSGDIHLPMMKQNIHVAGVFPADVETLIADALKREHLLIDPFVTVTVSDYHSRPISVTGAVKNPTIFQAIGAVSLLDALAKVSGGPTDNAGGEIIVTRPDELPAARRSSTSRSNRLTTAAIRRST